MCAFPALTCIGVIALIGTFLGFGLLGPSTLGTSHGLGILWVCEYRDPPPMFWGCGGAPIRLGGSLMVSRLWGCESALVLLGPWMVLGSESLQNNGDLAALSRPKSSSGILVRTELF